MSFTQQINILKHQRTFWLSLGLFVIIALSYPLAFLQSVSAFFYHSLSDLTYSQQSNIVVVQSKKISQEHELLVKQLQHYSVKAIVVLADEHLSEELPKQNGVFYPHPDSNFCVPKVSQWSGYNILMNQNKEANCEVIWPAIFEHYKAQNDKLINFSLSLNALPKFNAERILKNDVMREQLKDKIVFVGQQPAGFGVNLNVPQLQSTDAALYLYAYVADTIDKKTAVTLVPIWQGILLGLSFTLLMIFAYQKLSISYSIVFATFCSSIWLAVTYIFLNMLQLFLPIGYLIVISYFILIWVTVVRKFSEDVELEQLIFNIQQKMMGRFLPKPFIEQSSPWDGIIKLVTQQLALNKSIFLERNEGDHRVTEIRAVNCQLTDIKEMRRDYKRAPYSDALKTFGVISIERTFFEKLEEGEQQYIVPLTYAGDIRGFWALTVTPNEHFNKIAFEKNVNAFASQIGELLFHYHIYASSNQVNNSSLSRFLTLKLRTPMSQQIKLSLSAIEQKLTTLEHIFNNIRSASVLFNLFGQVIQTNHAIDELGNTHKLSIYEMSALDLLCKATGLDVEIAKGKLRYVTLQKGNIYLRAALTDRLYILNIKAISSNSLQTVAGDTFQVSGILFEFIDITFFNEKMPNSNLTINSISEQQLQNKVKEQ